MLKLQALISGPNFTISISLNLQSFLLRYYDIANRFINVTSVATLMESTLHFQKQTSF